MERSLEGRLRRGAIAPRVGGLHCIDPSPNALAAARATLRKHPNAKFHLAAVGRRFHPAERLYLTVLRKRADGRWRLFRDANLVS